MRNKKVSPLTAAAAFAGLAGLVFLVVATA